MNDWRRRWTMYLAGICGWLVLVGGFCAVTAPLIIRNAFSGTMVAALGMVGLAVCIERLEHMKRPPGDDDW